MKIVFIGNSIINGFPLKRSQCFVSLFREATGHQVINKGVNGAKSLDVLERFQTDVISLKPNKAYILTGTNDFITGGLTPDQTLENLNKMVDLCREANIIPVLMTPFLTQPEMAAKLWTKDADYIQVNEYLNILREKPLAYGKENDIQIVDTQPVLSSLITKENESMYLEDGLHPTPLGHRIVADYLLKTI